VGRSPCRGIDALVKIIGLTFSELAFIFPFVT